MSDIVGNQWHNRVHVIAVNDTATMANKKSEKKWECANSIIKIENQAKIQQSVTEDT